MELLTVGDRTFEADELMPLLSKTGMLPRLVQEVVIDTAIADIELTAEEMAEAEADFCQRNQIATPENIKTWAQQRYGPPGMVSAIAKREAQLAKFKRTSFDNEVDSYFLQRKRTLDRVLYSLIRTKQIGLAQELYFRINDDGHPFADLARQYSEGQEAKTGGLIGPVELSVPHPSLASMLSISQPGQVWHPKRIGEWYVVIRLEKFLPAQLDDAMRQRLLDELFQQWLKEQMQTLVVEVPTLMTMVSTTPETVAESPAAETADTEAPKTLLPTQPGMAAGSLSMADLPLAENTPTTSAETDPWT